MRVHRPVPLGTRQRVSVVIPCYRYGRYLEEVVASVLDQPGLDVDVLVVDDASPDDSAEIAQAIAAREPRVRVLVNDPNIGHIATYNRGIAEVTGDYVVLLSADDLVTPGAFTRAVALMQAHPSVGFVHGYPQQFTDEVPSADLTGPTVWQTWRGHDWVEMCCRRGNGVVINPEVVMRREVMDELGAYDPDLPHGADIELWMRAALHWDVGRVSGVVQGLYRQHGQNMHLQVFGGLMDDLVGRRLVFDSVLEGSAVGVLSDPHRRRLRGLAHRALAREATRLAVRAVDNALPGSLGAVEQYLEFAASTWPTVTTTPTWRGAQARLSLGGPLGRRSRAEEAARVVRDKVRWRVWRRLGV